MPSKKKNQPAPIVLADYEENEDYLVKIRDAQQTLEDKLWFGYEYKAKNELMTGAAGSYKPEEAMRYGFNPSSQLDENEADIEAGFRSTYREMLANASIEDYKVFFKALGSMKARTTAISGKHYESIEKALDENTPDRKLKAFYLYRASALTARSDSCALFCDNIQSVAEGPLGSVFKSKYDYKTVTMRQFAQDMGLDLNKLKLSPGDADKTVYELRRPQFPNADEKGMEEAVLRTLETNFSTYFLKQGENAEVEKMTEEQKGLYRKALDLNEKGEEANLGKIEDWIKAEGEQLGDNLREATEISNMKYARYQTQLSGSYGYNDKGFLDAEIKRELARTRYISDILGKKKDIEQVKEGIINKANQRFYAESLRRYPEKTPAHASYENYVTLHTGIKAGNTPEEMVENLGKALSGCALRELDRKFDLKEARSFGQHFKELFALDALKMKPELLKSALRDNSSVLKMGQELKKKLYGVTPDKQQAFSEKMRTLQSHLMSTTRRSTEYKQFCKAVKTCAELEEKLKGKSPEEKEKAYCQANLDVFEAARKYMDGKESVRVRDTGKLSFDHALDALAICSETSPDLSVRTDKIIGNINRVRNRNDPTAANYIAPATFHEHYGAARSNRSVADYSGGKRTNNIVNDPVNEKGGPGISGQ